MYDFSLSKTFQDTGKDVTTTFGTGKLLGQVGWDTITLGGYTIENAEFAEIIEYDERFFKGIGGLMGLSYPDDFENVKVIFDSMMEDKRLDRNIFSVIYYKDLSGADIQFGVFNETNF